MRKKRLPKAVFKPVSHCPYCFSTDFVKAGFRKKKFEKIQLFYCKHCKRKFTPLVTKSKTYPISIILKSLILYNQFLEPEEIAERIKQEYGLKINPATISNWAKEYQNFTPFQRMREYLKEKLKRKEIDLRDMVVEQKLFHKQIFDFKYHRWKTEILLQEDFKNYKLKAIKDYLELIVAECPHQIFRESNLRASEFKNVFNLDEVRFAKKKNRANEMANFVMQAIANNKTRHLWLEDFVLFCDSTTIATEVPVLLEKDDVDHFQTMLNFNVPLNLKEGEVITGHIDILQLRNGAIHILDFKPNVNRAKPIHQLTLYALALSRLTGLRLYNFKCAWFNHEDYFEFFPLHIVYKKKKRKKRKR